MNKVGTMAPGLLSGIRVLEVSTVISGPYAGMILSDLGAEVTKIESPDGDPFRVWGRSPGTRSAFFESLNRGKQSVSLDLKSAEGRTVFRKMCSVCDVVLENFRPGALESLGLGYEALREENERLVYCSISGFGAEGPDAAKPAYDAVVQAKSGFWSQLVDRASPEAIGPPIVDQVTGLFAAVAIASALAGREASGRGERLNISMLEAALAFQPLAIADYLDNHYVSDAYSRAYSSQSYGFTTSDGKAVAVHMSSREKFWKGLQTALKREDLSSDPRFVTVSDRVEHYRELQAILTAEVGRYSRDEVLAALEANDVPCSPINDVGEALSEAQVSALGALRPFGDGASRSYVVAPGTAKEPRARGLAPACGADGTRWMDRLGYSAEDVEGLRKSGALGPARRSEET